MGNRSIFGAAAIIAAVALLASCSSNNDGHAAIDPQVAVAEAEAQLRAIGAAENAELLTDGEISTDDYYAAARRYQSCLRILGIEILGPQISPVDNITLEWLYPETMPSGEDLAAKVDICNSHWSPMVIAYQMTHDSVMDEALREYVAGCLLAIGYETDSAGRNVREIVGPGDDTLESRLGDVEGCIIQGAEELYPELYGVTVIY